MFLKLRVSGGVGGGRSIKSTARESLQYRVAGGLLRGVIAEAVEPTATTL